MMIGFDNHVPHWKVAAILMPGRTASKRLRDRAAAEGRLLDARHGRRCRSLVVTDANQVILSAVAPETLRARLEKACQGSGFWVLGSGRAADEETDPVV